MKERPSRSTTPCRSSAPWRSWSPTPWPAGGIAAGARLAPPPRPRLDGQRDRVGPRAGRARTGPRRFFVVAAPPALAAPFRQRRARAPARLRLLDRRRARVGTGGFRHRRPHPHAGEPGLGHALQLARRPLARAGEIVEP